MSAEVLSKYGLRQVATVRIADRKFIIEVTDAISVELEKCLYAFLVGGEIVRIGSSKAKLKSRLRSWERDVSRALQGLKSPTPAMEAAEWERRLEEHGSGILYARQGSVVKTPVGEFYAYMDEESILIGRHLPPLNRSKHR